ncbi:TRAM domain-containing protein [Haloferax namakaokahaiae]|uniref:TRAM domain-containing protein n=1 Tax=Haloferax namakaokahaiae TaxID=1748331 RepID=A0ABD5ZCV2_9EURY
MMDISDSLRLLFETTIERSDDRYLVEIPAEIVENSSISPEETYRIALLTAMSKESEPVSQPETSESTETTRAEQQYEAPSTQSEAQFSSSDPRVQGPPVEEGEIRSVTVDTLGDQGDGIAKVERGFVIIIPGTQPGDQVDVEITDVKQTVAFAETVSEPTVR